MPLITIFCEPPLPTAEVAMPKTFVELATDCSTCPALVVSISTRSFALMAPVTTILLLTAPLALPVVPSAICEPTEPPPLSDMSAPSVVLPTIIWLFDVSTSSTFRGAAFWTTNAVVLPAFTVVAPLSDTAPVPVLKVPVPLWLKFLPEAIVTLPFRLTAPVVVSNDPEPLKAMFGLLVLLPMLTAVPFVPLAILTAAAPPTSRMRLWASLVWRDKVPALLSTVRALAAVGWMRLPIVIFAPVTVKVLDVVPPATVKPSDWLVSDKPLSVPANVLPELFKVRALLYVPDNPADCSTPEPLIICEPPTRKMSVYPLPAKFKPMYVLLVCAVGFSNLMAELVLIPPDVAVPTKVMSPPLTATFEAPLLLLVTESVWALPLAFVLNAWLNTPDPACSVRFLLAAMVTLPFADNV